ncbi:MAG: calcium-binding protein [Synechococcales cyanobacterium M58_A2018_015]|nr:calcium-binding protein [Synechococcales cyanobacterium M58_A2018_015]
MARGTNGNNRWIGTAKKDTFFALAGDDICIAGAGNDRVDGGGGKDIVRGGDGDDTLLGGAGDDKIDGGAGDDTIDGGAGRDRLRGGVGDDTVNGGSGNDEIFGGDGSDTLDGGSGNDKVFGDLGDDQVNGGSGNDQLDGGDGNDFVSGNTGDDTMLGGRGDDTLDWDDGDGNDIMSGGEGRDTIEVDGAVARGDNFVLGKNAAGKAFFERVGLDGQLGVGRFDLTVDTAEIFDVSGDGGNDTFIINDLTGTGVELIQFDGGEGNDSVDARNTKTRLEASGGNGDDILTGGTGTITFTNPATNLPVTLGDSLTGGGGKDKFQFFTDPFANGNPAQALNQPDVITDYEQGIDQVVFSKQFYGDLKFSQGRVADLAGDSNLLVLTGDTFANAGQAAAAIAANNKITAGKGVFVYYNSTLGISRAVFSSDLGNGGPFSVQANYNNLTSVKFQDTFTAADFATA